jgi:uncharacterized phiE125 gp8 family phage protein
MLHLVTGPSDQPITTEAAKLHLKVEHSDDDDLIATLCAAALDYVETGTRRKCLTQTWDDKRDGFPCWGEPWVLDFPPVSAVSSISYVDTNGTTQTWSSAEYVTDLPTGAHAAPGRIWPAYSYSWPQTRTQRNCVTVRFVCGFATAELVPSGMVAAQKLLIGHWYAHRETVVVGTITQQIGQAADALIWQHRA